MKKLLLVFTCLLLIIPTHGFAVTIVDTGEPPDSCGGWSLYYTQDNNQWLAAEFSIDNPGYTITDIEGWMKSDPGKSLTLAVYGDGGGTPDASNELYSGIITSSASGNIWNDWYGLHNLAWSLDAGTYWVSFEVRPGNNYNGSMPFPAPNPLGKDEARWQDGTWIRISADHSPLDIGVRIEGDPVPEPATMLLLGSGLVGIVGFRRKKFK